MVTYCPHCRTFWKLTNRIVPPEISCPKCRTAFALETWYDSDVAIDPGNEDIMATPVVEQSEKHVYNSTMKLAITTAGVLFAMMILSMFDIWFLDNSLSNTPEQKIEITEENYENLPPPPVDRRLQYVFQGQFGMMTAAWIFLGLCFAVSYLFWLHLTYKNLYALVPCPLTFTPKTVLLWHLMPVANLFVSIIALYDIWKSGNPRFLGIFKRDSNAVSMGMLLLGIALFAQFVIVFMALFFPVDIPYAINSMISRLILKNFIFFITTPFFILVIIGVTINQGRRWNLVMAKQMERNYIRKQHLGSTAH